ncbi:pilus assembly protein CpaA [Caulobacter radicis]|uniref:A24 family peptidase n=1 Tax=Caulobacter radicis TaxID=2172650 RepID=UPI000D575333|nr:prepilin peptidase [Caulobacter radicis]PVM88491.1 pilus assembly protein CpaA [Caulobacter radicis]
MEIDFVRLTGSIAYATLFIVAAGWDAWTRKIPNWTVAALAVLFLFAQLLTWSTPNWLSSFSAFGLVMLAGVPMFARRLIGAGDVKLLAVAALFAGMENLLLLLVATAIAGGALALVALAARPYAGVFGGWIRTRAGIPYGVAIAAGALHVGTTTGMLAISQRLTHLQL